jgi:hypothetical protein
MANGTTIHPPPGAGIPALRYRTCLNTTGNISVVFCLNETAFDEDTFQESLHLIQKVVAVVVPLLFGLIVLVGLIGNALVSLGLRPRSFPLYICLKVYPLLSLRIFYFNCIYWWLYW